MSRLTQVLPCGLLVSCQALENEPLHSAFIMQKMALAALEDGAIGIRANSGKDIAAIKDQVSLPLIGIVKRDYPDSEKYRFVSNSVKHSEEKSTLKFCKKRFQDNQNEY